MRIRRPDRRRGAVALLALALAVALSPAARAADEPARPVLFVGNVWDGTVTLIDAGTLHVIKTLSVETAHGRGEMVLDFQSERTGWRREL